MRGRKRALLTGIAALAVGGCTYHVHIHNHIPPSGQARPGTYTRAPNPSPHRPVAPSPYGNPPPRRDALVGLLDGSFSSGRLEPGWRAAGTEGGFAAVVTQGHAWSGSTQHVAFPSPPHAALIRSSGSAPVSSIGVLVSQPFIVAGRTLAWKQLSEAPDVNIVVEVEDAAGGGVIAATKVAPSVGAFQEQQLDVTAACGRPVRVLIRQHTNAAGYGYFTVFDDVGVGGHPCGPGNPFQPTHL